MSGSRAHKRRGGGKSAALLGAATLIAGGTIISLAPAASADNTNSFSLSAEGDGAFFNIDGLSANILVTSGVPASPFSAQSVLDSSGNSSAFAGLPYLGPIVGQLPGTVNGLSGGATPPIPPAPGFIAAQYPGDPTADQSQGPYQLAAAAQEFESSAKAALGLTGNSGQTGYSTAHTIAKDDGSVEAAATAGVNGFSIGPITALNVSSSVDITQKGNADPTITYSQNLGTFTMLGFKVGITQDGFSILGANLPLPTATILDTVNTALAAGGVKIEVVPSSKTFNDNTKETTFTTGALRVTYKLHVPTEGDTTTTLTLGRGTVTASDIGDSTGGTTGDTTGGTTGDTSGGAATTGTGDVTSAGTTGDVTSTGGATGTTGTTVAGDTGSTGDVTSSSGDLSGSGGAVVDTSTGGSAPVVGDSSSATGDVTGGAATAGGVDTPTTQLGSVGFVSNGPTGTDSYAIYLVLVLAAAAILVGQRLFAYFGVKLMLSK